MSKRVLLLLLLSVGLSGCGAFMRMAYNNSDTALRLMAHDYFDIEGAQVDLVQSGLQRFHSWHRREELPRYASLFEDASQRIDRGLQRADVLWAIETVRTRYRSLADQAIDEAMPALATINADNVVALEAKFAEKNEEFSDEFLEGSSADRERAQVKAYKKRLGDWLGDLKPAQERLIVEFVRVHPQASAIKLEERKRRQEEMLAVLRQPDDRAQLRARLRDYFQNFERNRSPQHAEYAHRFESDFVDLIISIDRSLNPAQRQHVAQRFARYAQDFRVLANEGGSMRNDTVAAN